MKHFDTLIHILLFLGFAIGGGAIWWLRYDSLRQFLVIIILVIFYLLWGVVYHSLKKDLTKKLFIEYLILAGIAIVVGFLVFGQ